MDFSDKSPIPGAEMAILNPTEYAGIYNEAAVHTVTNIASTISTFLNSLIYLTITLTIIAFFAYLLRYIFSKDDTDTLRDNIRGATRAGIALFIMVNMWGIIGLAQKFADISPVLAYWIVIISFLLVIAWSLFSIGDALVFVVSRLSTRIVDGVLALFMQSIDGTRFGYYMMSTKLETRRFIVAATILTAFTAYTFLFAV